MSKKNRKNRKNQRTMGISNTYRKTYSKELLNETRCNAVSSRELNIMHLRSTPNYHVMDKSMQRDFTGLMRMFKCVIP